MGECSEDAELATQLVVGRVVVVAFIHFPLGTATFSSLKEVYIM